MGEGQKITRGAGRGVESSKKILHNLLTACQHILGWVGVLAMSQNADTADALEGGGRSKSKC